MTINDLVDLVAREEKIAKADAKRLVHTILAAIGDAATKGEEIALNGFGKFTTRKTPARDGRHPRTGEKMVIKATTKISFKPAQALKDKLNG